MRMLAKGVLLLVCIWLGICTFRAQATPITFVFSANGVSGTLDSNPFSDASLVVTVYADTPDIAASDGDVFGSNTILTGTFSLSGIGSGSFDELLYVFDNQDGQVVGFGQQFDLAGFHAPGVALDTYDMKSTSGPIDVLAATRFSNVGTSLGSLTLSSRGEGTFQAICTTHVRTRTRQRVDVCVGLAALGILLAAPQCGSKA